MILERIPEFYANKGILITGASGFMGKVLLEKLLRSCSDLKKIYVIVRTKKDKSPSQRWHEVTMSEVFSRLKTERPGILENKVQVLEGDMSQVRLGLSDEDYRFLQENVSIIFHVAASVRFNDPLPDAVIINLRGTHEVIKLALGAKILAFIHVSTTFCNCYQTKSEEKLYPPPADWRKTIEIAEKLDRREASILGPKYLGVFPNTYTFTKNLAEAMIWDYRDKLPFAIMRPSIVIASISEPIPGWIDNINGPIGLILAAGKGIVRISYVNVDAVPDYMAADIAIKAIIVAGWHRSQSQYENDVFICNMASPEKSISNGEMMKMAMRLNEVCPSSDMLWYPTARSTNCKTWFQINAIFVHLIPALIVDQIMKALGKEPMLTKIQQRVHTAMMALGYFTTKPWTFTNEKFIELNKKILPKDKENFDFDFLDVDPYAYFRQGIKVGKKIILNEDEDLVLPQALKRNRRMYWLDRICSIIIKCFMTWIILKVFSLL